MSKTFTQLASSTLKASKEFTSSHGPSDPGGSSVFRVEWPQLESREYATKFDQFRKEMEANVIKQAKEKALFIEREAYEKGFAQGEKDGWELGQKRCAILEQQLQKLLQELGRQQEDLYQKNLQEMVQLLLCITRKILHQESLLPPEIIRATLQEAFQYVLDRKKVIVHLNPKDYQYIFEHPENLPFSLSVEEEARGGIKILEDPTISRGGCFLETIFGDVDATLEGQFDQIASQVGQRLTQPQAPPERSTP